MAKSKKVRSIKSKNHFKSRQGTLLERPRHTAYQSPLNTGPNYGITASTLASFKSSFGRNNVYRDLHWKRARDFLSAAYEAIGMMHSDDGNYGITQDMFLKMHPAEILATLVKGRSVINAKALNQTKILRRPYMVADELRPEDIPNFIDEAVAYQLEGMDRTHGFAVFYNSGAAISANPRLATLRETQIEQRFLGMEEALIRFIETLKLPYRNVHTTTHGFPTLDRVVEPQRLVCRVEAYFKPIESAMGAVYRKNLGVIGRVG